MKYAFVCLLGLAFPVFGPVFADYNPYYNNALADVRLRLVDDEGTPVRGATVTAAFYISDTRTTGLTKETGADGIVEAKYPCNGEFKVWARKDGYYDTVLKTTAFITLTEQEATRTQRWSNGTVDIQVVLKKKRKPVKTIHHDVNFAPIPATNEVVCLDLETFKWCPPYGNGKHRDLHLLYESWQNPTNWLSYYRKLTITTPNCVDGFTVGKADSFSRFGYAYRADTNATYRPLFVMELDRRSGHITKNVKPKDDEYLIYRVRTQTNELGRVTAANYGRIGEKPSHMFGLRMRSWFNPTPNDTNLEDSRP